jgi:hypothetical protein
MAGEARYEVDVMRFDHLHGGQSASRDQIIAALADRQQGVVARRQLIALGYTSRDQTAAGADSRDVAGSSRCGR